MQYMTSNKVNYWSMFKIKMKMKQMIHSKNTLKSITIPNRENNHFVKEIMASNPKLLKTRRKTAQ